MIKKVLSSVIALCVVFPLVNSEVEASSTYQVKNGDTLWFISVEQGVKYSDLLASNKNISNPNIISVGQQLTIPASQNGTTVEQSSQLSQFEQEVVRLTNIERENQGLSPLQIDNQVSKVARIKSEDMRDQNYFSHQSPTHGSPFDMLKNYGVSYRGAGENIAAGQSTPQQVVQGWMNSQGHRENILKSSFTHIGVGHVEGGSYGHYWTQMFTTK
ncbi:hypothetical protein CR203_00040 [Salipaludibacillus neizhouensis]|uniref:LysM domain-containing protein n=1 Tax=Salipaludibacillus neizhouensis TaxID=885475 RepID=A0A3A9KKZ6_9BACI|nr:CAP domain-containing protein [Salipaludibacillus neizhouensis]RKL68485.1 hypothetical protein CR203_00040 [Salipaludibacillus neizhouensis]